MDRSTSRRALDSLSHPAAVSAVLILLLNGCLLKPYFPSWWTGKLSDAAWLVVVPLVIAALMALITPRRAEHVVGPLAFFLCAGCFILLKASPETNRWLLEPARRLTGIPWYTLGDPTDLLALPAIGVGWLLWTHSKYREGRRSARRWPALALAALALIADAAAPFHAIACLRQEGDAIIAYSNLGQEFYSSADGGMSWQSASPATDTQLTCGEQRSTWEISQPGDDQVRYRLTYGEGIEHSADGGRTWGREVSLNSDEARYYYYRKFVAYDAGPGPYDALFDSHTGNLVIAMGFEGALVRDTKGTWNRVAVGTYHHEDLGTDKIAALLSGEIGLAVLVVFLIFPLLDRVGSGFRRRDIVLAVASWLPWVFSVVLSPAGIGRSSYMIEPIMIVCMLVSAISAVIWLVVNKTWKRRLTSILRGALLSLCGALLFLLPFLLWARGTLAHYQAAQIAALVMLIILLTSSIAGMLRDRRNPKTTEIST